MSLGRAGKFQSYVWPEWMRYSDVGTRELSQREMEYNLKMAQDYRQQLELKLENLKLKRARVWQEGQLIEEERAASVGAYETEPEGAVVVESEVEALGSLSSAQPVEGFVESESGFWLEESSQSESASGKDVQDAQGQQVVPSADPVRDGCRGAELMTTISTSESPVIIVTDLEHKSRDQHNEVSFPPGAGGVALSFQPAALDHAMQWEGADEGHFLCSAEEWQYDEGMHVIIQQSESAAIATKADACSAVIRSCSSPSARRGKEGTTSTSRAFQWHGPQPRSHGGMLSKVGGGSFPRVATATLAFRESCRSQSYFGGLGICCALIARLSTAMHCAPGARPQRGISVLLCAASGPTSFALSLHAFDPGGN